METYIVKQGDTLEKIGNLYNIPVTEIVKLNKITYPYILTEGQVLNIPTAMFNIYNYYTVKQGDTLYKIAINNNVTPKLLAQINGLNEDDYIYPNQTILIPKPNISMYVTEEGDTISKVAEYFKTSKEGVIYSNTNIYLQPDQLLIYKKI